MEKRTVIIYHGDCADGFGAAFAAWLVFGDEAEYLPYAYGMAPPNVAGREVYILDFSFEPDVLVEIEKSAAALYMLDHHKSAKDKLSGFKCRCGFVHIDMDRSGARMAWEYFHPETDVPELIALIEDRDLWRWKYPDAKDYLAALDVAGYDFAAWQALMNMTQEERHQFVLRGKAMNDKFQQLCRTIAADALPLTIDGIEGLAVSAAQEFGSEVGALLAAKSGTFGAVWRVESPQILKVSLRSVAPFEVEPIARRFGGGGHMQASAMRIPASKLPEIVNGRLSSAS